MIFFSIFDEVSKGRSYRNVTDEMFLVAARTLSRQVTYADRSQGSVYQSLTKIRDIPTVIAVEVAETAYRQGLARVPRPDNLASYIKSLMYFRSISVLPDTSTLIGYEWIETKGIL
jgi:malic enzyme